MTPVITGSINRTPTCPAPKVRYVPGIIMLSVAIDFCKLRSKQ